MRVLVLGGTAEARAVVGRLVVRGDTVVSSLAGRVSSPARMSDRQVDALVATVSAPSAAPTDSAPGR